MIKEVNESSKIIPVKDAASSLGVSRSGYYKWASQESDLVPDDDPRIKDEIVKILEENPGYGYRRVTPELRRRGFKVNHKRVRRIMKENNLLFKKKRFKPTTTDSNHNNEVYPNLIKGIEIVRPNQVWASDITYIRLLNDFVYLAVIIDLYARRCIGWELSRNLDTQLALNALKMALDTRKGEKLDGLIHHSDQGVQYASKEYVQCLKGRNIQISMSRKGNPYDNAFVESFIKSLKTEEVYLNEYETFRDALENIGRFIDEVYNKKRLHSSLGYKTPIEFEKEAILNIEA